MQMDAKLPQLLHPGMQKFLDVDPGSITNGFSASEMLLIHTNQKIHKNFMTTF